MSDSSPPRSATAAQAESVASYRVLARKYRPASFEDLIGQEALVRTLTNALDAGRMPQAFVLTGVRGVGKTTTARILARALNCIGPDGQGGPTAHPCGVCENCTAIAADRHVDVIEMDAASRTGVDDIRDLIDGVRYRPVSARRKVYVVDEVHMLSKNAFNALLKTLEEPPAHVTFVFATTEIRKVPVTVLSRCMRFDLRRIDHDVLVAHFRDLLDREGIAIDDEALAMVARAADGSVRDGLSLLDQAIALADGPVTGEQVKSMLGLADRGHVYDLYDAVLHGQPGAALAILGDLYAAGADPAVVLQDMLEVTHTLTRLQVVGEGEATAGLPETERTRGRDMAQALRPATLARNWQMLLKGLQETQHAPQPRQAAEMVLVRLIHAVEAPPPAEILKQLRGSNDAPTRGPTPDNGTGGGPSNGPSNGAGGGAGGGASEGTARAMAGSGQTGPQHAPQAKAETTPQPAPAHLPENLRAVVALCHEHRESRLAADIKQSVHLVRFEAGRIEFRPGTHAPSDLAGRLGKALGAWTGRRWVVSISDAAGDPTLDEQDAQAEEAARRRLLAHPMVQSVLEAFPGAELVAHRGDPADMDDAGGGAANADAPVTADPETITALGDPDAFEGDDEL
mgnify:CR=1 FL=1